MKYFSLLAISTLLIVSCEKGLSPLNQDEVFNNLTYFKSPEGVIYKLEGLKDIYSLDEKIEARFTVINKSDTTKYHIFTYSGPVFSFSTFNKNNDRYIITHLEQLPFMIFILNRMILCLIPSNGINVKNHQIIIHHSKYMQVNILLCLLILESLPIMLGNG